MEPLDFQKPALAEITARARAYFAFWNGPYRDMLLQPRWACILVAPTAVGKTTTASMVSEAIGASMLRISAPSYMPTGAHNRGCKETIIIIAQHVAKNDRTLLVVDELDKINDPDNTWHGYIRNELMDLIGGVFPTGLNMDDCDLTIEALNEKLRTTVFILGIGTFQSFFDSKPSRRSIGFGNDDADPSDEITAEIIAQRLPRELSNRFGKIVRLPELKETDYYQIAQEAERKLPEPMRIVFREEVSKRIPEAIEAKKGVRYIEEAVTATLIHLQTEPTLIITPVKTIQETPECTL